MKEKYCFQHFYMLANRNVLYPTLFQKVSRGWWEGTSCHLSTHPELFTSLPSLPSGTEIATTPVSTQLKKLGLGCFRLGNETQYQILWKSWFPWHSQQPWKEARRGSHHFTAYERLALIFSWAIHSPNSEVLGRKTVYTWRPELMRSSSVLQMHLTLANGTAFFSKAMKCCILCYHHLSRRCEFFSFVFNGTLTGNIITRES